MTLGELYDKYPEALYDKQSKTSLGDIVGFSHDGQKYVYVWDKNSSSEETTEVPIHKVAYLKLCGELE